MIGKMPLKIEFFFIHCLNLFVNVVSYSFDDTFIENSQLIIYIIPHIDTLKSDYQLYYSNNVYDPGFDGLYIEKDGHLWHLTGYGGDPSWYYDEVVELLNISDNRISYKVVHHIAPEFYEHYGYEYREEVFSLVYEEGRWKCDKISPHN